MALLSPDTTQRDVLFTAANEIFSFIKIHFQVQQAAAYRCDFGKINIQRPRAVKTGL